MEGVALRLFDDTFSMANRQERRNKYYGTLRAPHRLFGRVYANGRFAELELDQSGIHIRASWPLFRWFIPSLDLPWSDIDRVERRDLSLRIRMRDPNRQPVTFGGQRPGQVNVILGLMERMGGTVDWTLQEEALFGD